MQCTSFYTYAYLREDRTPYYIGKGRGNRAWSKSRRGARRPKNDSRILLLKKGLTEEEAFRHERYMIFVLGRKDLKTGILRNLTGGGEGASGLIHSEETRRKRSEAMRGRKINEEVRRRISEAHRGKKMSEGAKEKISMARRGKPRSEEIRAKISNTLKGREQSEEHKRKSSEARKGEKNCSAKSFLFINPLGEGFLVTGRFRAFCDERGIAWRTMYNALRRNCSPPPRNGWKVCYADEAPQPLPAGERQLAHIPQTAP